MLHIRSYRHASAQDLETDVRRQHLAHWLQEIGLGWRAEIWPCLSLVQFSRSVVFDSLWPHRLQHARLPCPSPTPGAYSNSCPSSQWYHPTISSSVSSGPVYTGLKYKLVREKPVGKAWHLFARKHKQGQMKTEKWPSERLIEASWASKLPPSGKTENQGRAWGRAVQGSLSSPELPQGASMGKWSFRHFGTRISCSSCLDGRKHHPDSVFSAPSSYTEKNPHLSTTSHRPGAKQSISSCYLIPVMVLESSHPPPLLPFAYPTRPRSSSSWVVDQVSKPGPMSIYRVQAFPITASQVVLSDRQSASRALAMSLPAPSGHLPQSTALPSTTIHQLWESEPLRELSPGLGIISWNDTYLVMNM